MKATADDLLRRALSHTWPVSALKGETLARRHRDVERPCAALIAGLPVMRPWRAGGDRWLHESALAMALLLRALFATLL